MKKIITASVICICSTIGSYAQTSSVYSIEVEYAASTGYKYYFNKINNQTGSSTRLKQQPIKGHGGVMPFFNSSGNFVYVAPDSATTSVPVFKLYEIDTNGTMIRNFPLKAPWAGASGTAVVHLFQSPNSAKYYGIKRDSTDYRYLVSLDPVTGLETVICSVNAWNCVPKFNGVIDRDDNIYFFEAEGSTGYTRLHKASVANKTIVTLDSIESFKSNIFNPFYDCSTSTVYAFYADSAVIGMDMSGTELIKLDKTTGAIVHTGIKFTAAKSSFSAYTTLSTGEYYQLDNPSTAIKLNPSTLTGPVYALTNSSISKGPGTFTSLAAAPTSCGYKYKPTFILSYIQTQKPAIVYPNPVNDVLSIITGSTDAEITYTVLDGIGKCVFAGTIVGGSTQLSVASLSPGLYFVKLAGNNAQVVRFTKE